MAFDGDGGGWLVEDGVHLVRFFRVPIWSPSGGGGRREVGGNLAESLVWRRSTCKRTVTRSIGRVSTSFREGGGQLDRRRLGGVLNPCEQESRARTGEFLRKSLSLTTVCFLPTRVDKEWRKGKIRGAFYRNAQGFGRLDAGSRAGFTGSRLSPPWISVLQFSLFLHDDVWP